MNYQISHEISQLGKYSLEYRRFVCLCVLIGKMALIKYLKKKTQKAYKNISQKIYIRSKCLKIARDNFVKLACIVIKYLATVELLIGHLLKNLLPILAKRAFIMGITILDIIEY